MSIVSVAEAVPSRLFILYSSLIETSAGENLDRLKALATPASLSRGGNDEEGTTTSLFDNPMREMRALGLIEDSGDKVIVPPKARQQPRQKPEAAFREHVLATIFDSTRAKSAAQSQVAPALAWFLMQNPLRPVLFSDNPRPTILRQIEGDQDFDLSNASRLQTFIYWARYLGYASLIGAGGARRAIPDPTVAITRLLPEVFRDAREVRAPEFQQALADLSPVLEGGTIRTEVETRAREEVRRLEKQKLSRSTSLALQRLENRGVVVLEQLSDAAISILDLGSSTRRFSHVRYKGR